MIVHHFPREKGFLGKIIASIALVILGAILTIIGDAIGNHWLFDIGLLSFLPIIPIWSISSSNGSDDADGRDTKRR